MFYLFIHLNQTDISYYRSGLAAKKGKCRVFCGLDETYSNVAVVALGKKGIGYSEVEELDEGRENVRAAVSGMCTLWEFCHPVCSTATHQNVEFFHSKCGSKPHKSCINVNACLLVPVIRPVV